jgi:diadenylate cyclase
MLGNLLNSVNQLYQVDIMEYIQETLHNPSSIILTIIDIAIVIAIIVYACKMLRNTRAWQLLKGIFILVVITFASSILRLKILNYILSLIMMYGGIMIIVIFQPEIRRGLDQLGSNKFGNLLGLNKDTESKKKENVYKIAIAVMELAKSKTGALIVFERDVKIQDIIATGIPMESEISPQLICNIFVPNTPLHDGAVIIRDNKIAAASCMLPLADDQDIARELGTRHRAAIGVSKESDAIAVVVSEETGKVSIAKDGTLIADLREDVLKKILLKNLVTESKIKTEKLSNNESKKIEKNEKEA